MAQTLHQFSKMGLLRVERLYAEDTGGVHVFDTTEEARAALAELQALEDAALGNDDLSDLDEITDLLKEAKGLGR